MFDELDEFVSEMQNDILTLELLHFGRPKCPRVIRPRVDLFNYYSDEQFIKQYRMDKGTVMALFLEIKESLTPRTMRNHAVEPMNKLLCTLRFFATGTYMMLLGDLGGYSETSARTFVHMTSHAIAALRPKYVKVSNDDLDGIKAKFLAIAQFPNVIMAMDCTHVRLMINEDGEKAEVFRNRKGWFSLNVQMTCDAELRVLDCVARWPGSTHDQRIFDNSNLMRRLENGEFGSSLVLGDKGYTNRKYLVTPVDNCTSRAEQLFNESQTRTRNAVVERLYGVMKKRFPVLSVGLRCSVELAMVIIHAVTVCHNLALKDPLPDAEVEVIAYHEAKVEVERACLGHTSVQRQLIDSYFSTM